MTEQKLRSLVVKFLLFVENMIISLSQSLTVVDKKTDQREVNEAFYSTELDTLLRNFYKIFEKLS